MSGVGTGQTVALWEGASSVTDSETLGNAPITVSGSNTTFAGTIDSGNIVVENSGTPRLTLRDSGNGGGGGASGKIIYSNTAGNAIGLGYTTDITTTSDFIISTDAGSTYGGYLGLDAAAIADPSNIILDPKTNVYITKALGIGVETPNDLLDIHNSAAGAVDAQMNFTTAATGTSTSDGFRVGWNGTVAQMYLFEDADMRFATNNAEKMTITSAGGISFGSTGTAYGSAGQVLTSAGNASPTWTTPTTGTVTGSGTATQVAFWDASTSLSGNDDLYWDNANGCLGINDTTPNSRLKVTGAAGDTSIYTVDINHVRNDANVATHAMRLNVDLSGADTTTADRTNSGLYLDIDSSANGDSSNEHRIYGVNSNINFTGFTDIARGGYFLAESNYTGAKTAQLVGVYGYAIHDVNDAAGGVSNMIGTYGMSSIQDTGDVDNAFGVYGVVSIGDNRVADVGVTKAVEGEITIDKSTALNYGTMIGISSIIDNNEGSVPNFSDQYLFKGDYQGTKGATAWGIYTEGDKNYFEGKIGIGTTTPDTLLDVSDGTSGATAPAIRITNTLNLTDWSSNTEDLGRYEFYTDDTSGNAPYTLGYIGIKNDYVTGTPPLPSGAMTFGTTVYNTAGGASEKMRLTSGGNLGIGTGADVYGDLHLQGGQQDIVLTNDNADGVANLTISRIIGQARGYSNNGSAMQSIDFVTNQTTWYKGDIVFKTNNTDGTDTSVAATEKMRIASNGNVGIGFTSPDSTPLSTMKLSVNGNTYVSGNVGIGTTSPGTKLHVSATSSNSQLTLERTGSATGKYSIYTNTNNLIINNVAANTYPLTILNNGNIGIGTISPDEKLDVAGKVQVTGTSLTVLNASDPSLQVSDTDTNYKGAMRWLSSDNVLEFFTRYAGTYYTNNLVLDRGNVGIGTSTPNAKLDVQGTQGQLFSVTDDLSGSIFAVADISGVPILDVNSDGTIQFSDLGAGTLVTDASGNISVSSGGGAGGPYLPLSAGSSYPLTGNLFINNGFTLSWGADTTKIAGSSSTNELSLKTASTTRMLINSSGNVGIGTTSPGTGKLVVEGDPYVVTNSGQARGGIDLRTNAAVATGVYGAGISFGTNGSGRAAISSVQGSSDADRQGLVFFTHGSGTGAADSSEAMRISYDGKVGIASDSPGALLDVSDRVYIDTYSSEASGNNPVISGLLSIRAGAKTGWGADDQLGKVEFYGADTSGVGARTAASIIAVCETGNGTSTTTFSSGLALYTSPYNAAQEERMRIDASGNVGIGVTNPSSKLTIETDAGDGTIELLAVNAATTKNKIIFSEAVLGDESFFIEHDGSGAGADNLLKIHGDGSGGTASGITIRRDGRVGIGANSPSYLFDVRDGTTSGAIARFSAINPHVIIESSTAGPAVLHFKPNATGNKSGQFKVTAGNGYNFRWSNDAAGTSEVSYMTLDTSTTGGGDLTVKGDVIAYGAPSDRKYKENIKPIESALDKAMQLQGVTFDWKDSESILDIKEDIGFIAQDVEKVLPELVRDSGKGNLSLRYQGITPILLEAIKELKSEIEELKKQIK